MLVRQKCVNSRKNLPIIGGGFNKGEGKFILPMLNFLTDIKMKYNENYLNEQILYAKNVLLEIIRSVPPPPPPPPLAWKCPTPLFGEAKEGHWPHLETEGVKKPALTPDNTKLLE